MESQHSGIIVKIFTNGYLITKDSIPYVYLMKARLACVNKKKIKIIKKCILRKFHISNGYLFLIFHNFQMYEPSKS